jgi:hypothetical protein
MNGVRLLLDMGLPRRTAEDLSRAGWDAVHVAAGGRARASDQEIIAWARDEERTIVTLDADFASSRPAAQRSRHWSGSVSRGSIGSARRICCCDCSRRSYRS